MAAVRSIIGDFVVRKGNEKVDASTIFGPGRYVGLYFSAHWCPPCRAFTPELAAWYDSFRKTEKGSKFDIVFVSSDRDVSSFNSYFAEMPWLALEFEQRDAKNKLSRMFKVQGIPTLLILDGETGAVVTDDGRNNVGEDPEGTNFPWWPKTLEEILFSGPFIKNDKTTVNGDEFRGIVKGIYFSAHWCPPCRGFTPHLVETYKRIKADGKKFEIVFCSADNDEGSFDEYFSEMPWLALPYGDPRVDELNNACDVEGIPTLVILDENNKILTSNGRSEAEADPTGLNFPWPPKAVNKLSGSNADKLNDIACLVLFTDGTEESMEQAQAALSDPAARHFSKGDAQELFFFYASTGDIVEGLCQFAKLPADEKPLLAIIDVPDGKVFRAPPLTTISKEAVENFVRDYEAGSVTAESIR